MVSGQWSESSRAKACSRGLKPPIRWGGGLPRLKPGPISGTTAKTMPGAEARFLGGGGLPRLKPGPISEAKANAGVLPLHFVQGQDDGQKTSKGRFLRQAQDRLFDCASRDETARSSAQDDGKRDKGKGGGFRRKVRAAVAVRTSSGSFDSVTHDETVSHSAQDDSFFVLRQNCGVCGTGGDVHCIAGDLRSIEDYRLRDAGEGRAQG